MSTKSDELEALKTLLQFIGSLGEAGGRILQGIFSSPWTGVPMLLLIFTVLESNPKFAGITNKFLVQFGMMLEAGAGALGNAIATGLAGLGTDIMLGLGDLSHIFNLGHPRTPGKPQWCLKPKAIAGNPLTILLGPTYTSCYDSKDDRDSAIGIWTVRTAGAANFEIHNYTPLGLDVGDGDPTAPIITGSGGPSKYIAGGSGTPGGSFPIGWKPPANGTPIQGLLVPQGTLGDLQLRIATGYTYGPYATQSDAFIDISRLASLNITSGFFPGADGWYVVINVVPK